MDLHFLNLNGRELGSYTQNLDEFFDYACMERVLDIDNTPEGVYVVLGSDDLRVYLLKNPMIPEFPTWSMLLLTLTLLASVITLIKKRPLEKAKIHML
jgi:hypothetical protein